MNRRLSHAAAIAVLFVGASIANLRGNGMSPIAWNDTFNDETIVRQCIDRNSCTLVGVGTSIPGYHHAVGWFALRSLPKWLGLGLDGAHIIIQILNALAVVLVFDVARQLGGRMAGIVAASLFVYLVGSLKLQTAAVYNSAPLPFLGAVFVLACIAVVLRPGIVSVAMAALVAAIMANVHLACVLTGLSVVSAALLAPRHRIGLAIAGATIFAVATFIVAPQSWLHNAERLMNRPPPLGNAAFAARLEGVALMLWSLFAVAAWLLSWRSRSLAWVRCRQDSKGALAVMVPFIVAFLTARLVGVDADGKYLAHLAAATAIAVALPVARGARGILRARSADITPARRESLVWVTQIAPFVLAVLLPLTSNATRDTAPTIRDLRDVRRVLRDERGWTTQQMIENVKASAGMVVPMGLRDLALSAPTPELATADPAASALLLAFHTDEVPSPLPSNWTLIRSAGDRVLVLIVTRSRIDWSDFEVCMHPANAAPRACQVSGLRFDKEAPGLDAPNMPWGGPHWLGTLTLKLPLRPPLDGFTEAIFMPRMLQICGGRIARAPNGTQLDSDGRHATISAEAEAGERIGIAWDLGSPACGGTVYEGWPPFFVDGDAETVRLVETVFRKHEVGDGP